MSLFIANGNGSGGRILYTNPTRNHPYSHIPYRPQFLSSLRRSTDDHDLHVVSASNKKLSSSRIGKFDSKNRRSSSTTTKEQEEVKRVGGGGEDVTGSEVENVNTSVVVDFDYGIDLPKLPGDEPDFWEGPQWDGLGFFVQYLWAFGIVFAVIACGIAAVTYNEGATDFKETPAYKESIQSQDLLEEPEASNSDVFESNPTVVAPSLE